MAKIIIIVILFHQNVNVVKMDQLVLLVMTKMEFVNARKIILVKNVICAKLKPTDTLIVNVSII